jgi:hypothetical protein
MATALSDRLDVSRSRCDNSEVIVCRGWLDRATCEGLQALIDDALDSRVDRMRIDLRLALALDESGLDCLRRCAERCVAYGIGLEITCSNRIRRTLCGGPTRSLVALREKGVSWA